MCGIIGVIGEQDATPFLMEGLARLEYRGYDSAGIAVQKDQQIDVRRAAGRLDQLTKHLESQPVEGQLGIGHTRWATHGSPSEHNAHPHATQRAAIVHNGIIENFHSLKEGLQVQFTSETDSEVIVHLISARLAAGDDPANALRYVAQQLKGAFACAILFKDEGALYGLSRGSPLAVGLGKGQAFIASDALAMEGWADKICHLEDGDYVRVQLDRIEITDFSGKPVERALKPATRSGQTVSKGGFAFFMEKEINEQPAAIARALERYITPRGGLALPQMPDFARAHHVLMIGCGSSVHTAMIARYWIEKYAALPAREEIASEFRDRHAVIPDDTLIFFISQSGETADTLAAFRHCHRQGHPATAIVNAPQSTLARDADVILEMDAGPEIGVAATKTVTSQLIVLAACALQLAAAKGRMDKAEQKSYIQALVDIPDLMKQVLRLDRAFQEIADHALAQAHYVLHLGRNAFFPVALEGALKFKEITYIPSDGYAAGEMKHGPIAMIDSNVPVIALAPFGTSSSSGVFDKLLSNLQEVRARGGQIILISDRRGVEQAGDLVQHHVMMPDIHEFTAPILYVMAVQFLSYHAACARGLDVDRPRNLAKSVTVE